MIRRLDVRRKFLEDFARVAHQCGVDLNVFVDFRAVDLDVNLARIFRVGAQIAGDAIIKPHADGNQGDRLPE